MSDCDNDATEPLFPVVLPSFTTDYTENYDSDTCYSIVNQFQDFGDERYTVDSDSCTSARELFTAYKTYQQEVYQNPTGTLGSGLLQEVTDTVTANQDSVKALFDLLAADNMQTEAESFAGEIVDQFTKYGTSFSIENNLNCTDISQAYSEYREPLCDDVKKGFMELLAMRVVSLPLEIGLCIVGIRFVLRNKVDVPKYVPAKAKTSKDKKKDSKKKGKDGEGENEENEDEEDDESKKDENDQNRHQDDLNSSSSNDSDEDEGKKKVKKGCFLCCCCGGKKPKNPSKPDEADGT